MLSHRSIDPVVRHALDEDLHSGDLTTQSCIEQGTTATATAVARHPMVVAGGAIFKRTFDLVDGDCRVELCLADGIVAEANDVIWRVEGSARAILMAERVALNFVQRLSGIATLTRKYVSALTPGSTTRIADTRKTTPGLRAFERYAVRCGGAHNHRDNLGSAVMIKDNHIVASGGIAAAVARARQMAPHTCRIEVEVTNFAELKEAQAAGADIIMLDNMDTPTVSEALALLGSREHGPIVEASGGITLERVAELSAVGVDVISVGALTHSAPAADISLEFVLDGSS
jgi:nicotinate-nucleotide pyrophosphorylase (carboxylating)